MESKKLIPFINAENEAEISVVELAKTYARCGADELFLYNYSKEEEEHEQFIRLAKEVVSVIDIPVILGLYVARFEDIKKALYTGAKQVVVKNAIIPDMMEVKEGINRFGSDKVIIEVEDFHEVVTDEFDKWMHEIGFYGVLIKHMTMTEKAVSSLERVSFPVYVRDSLTNNDLEGLLRIESVAAVLTNHFEMKNIMSIKQGLRNNGIAVNTFDSTLSWEDFKLNSDGMIPVIAQDYKTNEVLMLAYMNQEAFEKTVAEGVMTYYSRSRNELWTKGMTSGNYQYVKALTIDCDNDTILAKVEPLGPACHTGNQTCFFHDLVKKEFNDVNPLTVLQNVYDIIMDRKKNPKEGSYTNYLFDKGIDKILKKCGEEATEIVIAAKNPDPEELKYEISDFLYHMMVLMAERGLNWNDIIKELAHRR